ncbi:MAG: hypothetical protein K2N95_00555 [Lachnospiraceae bacterium]|nr:hypothetical protein [Lachnospiraceae bacterium]
MGVSFQNILSKICSSAILAGVILFFIGAYYCVIKAGIPYQDPPLELQIEYAVNMGIGEILVKNGILIAFLSCIAHFVLRLIFKYCATEKKL